MTETENHIKNDDAEGFARAAWLCTYAALLVVLLAIAAPRRGPWFDEFWTYFFSDPAIGLKQAFFGRWAFDIHPPLFSALAYLSQHISRLSIEHARLWNFIPSALCAGYFLLVGRTRKAERQFLATFAVSVSSSAYFIEQFNDFRSYLTGICAFSVLLVTLKVLDRYDDARTARNGRFLVWPGFAVSLAVCLNIHYLTAVLAAIMVGVFGLRAALLKRHRQFWIYLVAGVILTIPLATFLTFQLSSLETMAHDYWLKTPVGAAVGMLAMSIATPISGSAMLVLPAWVLAAVLSIREGRKRGLDGFSLTLIAALFVQVAVLLVYTWLTAALTVRYLAPLQIIATAILCAILTDTLMLRRWLFAAFVLLSFAAAIFNQAAATAKPNWDDAARLLTESQKTCPGTRIVPMQQNPADHTPNTLENYNEAYQYMARKWGLTVAPVDTPPQPGGKPACPDLYWADHFFASGKTRAVLLSQFFERFPALQGCHVTVTTTKSLSAIFSVSGKPPLCHR